MSCSGIPTNPKPPTINVAPSGIWLTASSAEEKMRFNQYTSYIKLVFLENIVLKALLIVLKQNI